MKLFLWTMYWFMAGLTAGFLNENLSKTKKFIGIVFWPFLCGCLLWIYFREKSTVNEHEMIKDASRILFKEQLSSLEEKRPS